MASILRILSCILIFTTITNSKAQGFHYFSYGEGLFDGRFGATLGATNYITDTNLLFSKSRPGFSAALTASAVFSDRFELLIDIEYARNFSTFVGRKDLNSPQEDLKFHMDNFSVPFLLKFRAYTTKSDDWHFGLLAGPKLTFLHNWKLDDTGKEDYVLEPFYLSPQDLEFDTQNESISFNVFATVGLTAEYRKWMCRATYNFSVTDPYRNLPVVSPYVSFTGKDTYYALSLTYFFEDE